jgi:hypothetical protein
VRLRPHQRRTKAKVRSLLSGEGVHTRSLLTLALAVSFSSPLMAKSQSPSMTQSHVSKGLQSQKTMPIQGNSKSAAQGPVSDRPMNQPECKKAGGTWNDQTLTCNRKGKL